MAWISIIPFYSILALIFTRCPVADSLQCLSCLEVDNPSTCQDTKTCHESSMCVIQKYQTWDGGIKYNQGCSADKGCRSTPGPIFGRRKRQATNFICHYCCNEEDLCNDRCGQFEGSQYLVMFLPEYASNVNDPKLLVSSPDKGVISIEGVDGGVKNLTEGFNSIDISTTAISADNAIESKAMMIYSPLPISVFVLNYEEGTSDGYLVYPSEVCSTEYIVPSYTPGIRKSVVGIASLSADTRVNITVRTHSGSVSYNGKSYSDGSKMNITLGRLQTFALAHSSDLSGTRILASRPVCVTSGTTCSYVGPSYCSRLEEMIYPVEQFATHFIVPLIYTRIGSIARVMTYNTVAHLDITMASVHQSRSLSEYSFTDVDISANKPTIIISNTPVIVTQYVKGVAGKPKPFSMMAPAINQYLTGYNFSVVGVHGFTSYLTVIVPAQQTSGLRLDGTSVHPLTSAETVVCDGVSYDVFPLSISSGSHTMLHENGIAFGLFVYGNNYHDGYGYIAGIKFHGGATKTGNKQK